VLNEVMDQYISTGLVDEFNLAVSWISGLERRVHKDPLSEELTAHTRKLKQAAEWMHRVEAICHTDRVEMNRETLEPKVLLSYGKLVKRRVLDKDAEPYYSPFRIDYIDPAQVVEVTDGHGIEAVFRVYTAQVRDLARAYGDLSDGAWKKIKDKYGSDLTDESEIPNVVEYWDRWRRCVTAAGQAIVPMTEHMYGDVPFTIGLGPLGQPRMTMLPDASGSVSSSTETFRQNAAHQSVSYVRFRKQSHLQTEAIMTRALYGMQQDYFPAVIRYRSVAAANRPAPPLDSSPLAQNPALMGEEKIEPFPRNTQGLTAHQHLMEQQERDRMTGSAPMTAYGQYDQSNISGTANKQSTAAGLHLWKPWVAHIQTFDAADTALAFRQWKRLGHTVQYARPQPRPFTVPVPRPYKGEQGSFDLDATTIEKVGPDIQIIMSEADKSEWLLRAQTMEVMNKAGLPREWLIQELFNVEYDTRMLEEWQEEQSYQRMLDHPRFAEIIGVPAYIMNEMAEFEGDPEDQQLRQYFLDKWYNLVTLPAQLESDMKLMQLQQAMAAPTPNEAVPDGSAPGGAAPGGAAPGGPPPGAAPPASQPSQPPLPPTTSGVSLPDFGRGPSSRTGATPGPSGPQGPMRPAPQGGY
jgi:hypothetical protein